MFTQTYMREALDSLRVSHTDDLIHVTVSHPGSSMTTLYSHEEALAFIVGAMPFLGDDALSRIVLMAHAIDDERHGCEPPAYKDEDPDEYTQVLLDAEPEVQP